MPSIIYYFNPNVLGSACEQRTECLSTFCKVRTASVDAKSFEAFIALSVDDFLHQRVSGTVFNIKGCF